MTSRVATLALALAATIAGAAACSASDAGVLCTPGQRVKCSCQGALTGSVVCDSSGHEGPCNCSPGSGVTD